MKLKRAPGDIYRLKNPAHDPFGFDVLGAEDMVELIMLVKERESASAVVAVTGKPTVAITISNGLLETLLDGARLEPGGALIKTDCSVELVLPKNGSDFSLDELQIFVGGPIQVVPLGEEGLELLCNDEGKLEGMERNVLATRIWELWWGDKTDIVVGNVMIFNDRSGVVK